MVYMTLDTGYKAGEANSSPPNTARAAASLPAAGTPAATVALIMPVVTATPHPDGSVIHVVEPGQVLINIAAAYNMKLSELFGCANWAIKNEEESLTAEATGCMLCNIAKKMGAPCPCNIHCLDPMEGMIKGFDPDLNYDVKETLWSGQKCSVNVCK
jgi:hypothetical protein